MVSPRFSMVSSLALVALVGACRPAGDTDFLVDAELYIESTCESGCAKGEQCEAAWYVGRNACMTDCIEERTRRIDETACFVEETDVSRCWHDSFSCEEFARATTVPAGSVGQCRRPWDALVACLGTEGGS